MSEHLTKDYVSDLRETDSEHTPNILRTRFGIEEAKNHTYEVVGQELTVPLERLCQIEAKVIAKHKKHKDSRKFMEYLK